MKLFQPTVPFRHTETHKYTHTYIIQLLALDSRPVSLLAAALRAYYNNF